MKTPNLTPLLSVPSTQGSPSRSSEAADKAPTESFGQLLSRATEPKPRAEAPPPRRGDAAQDMGRRENSRSAPSDETARRAPPAANSKVPAAAQPAPDSSADAPSPATDATESDAEHAEADSAAELIDAVLLAATTTVQPPTAELAPGQAVALASAAMVEPPASDLPDVIASNQATDPAAPAPAGDNAADGRSASGQRLGQGQPALTDAQGTSAVDTADTTGEPIAIAVRGPAHAASVIDSALHSPDDTRAKPTLPTAAQPQRAAIAEALAAALAGKAAERDPSSSVAAGERSFEQLLGTRALTAPRAEPSTQSLPFSHLLGGQTSAAASVVATPVGQPGFAQDLGNRVLMLVSGQIKSAELALTPAELGPLRVSIEVRGQEASIAFVAAAAATRAALEEALPRLREMFSQQGLTLLDASVGAQVGQQGHRTYGQPPARRNDGRDDGEAASVPAVAGTLPAGAGRPIRLIDVIA